MGRAAAWWFPRWLDRITPRVDIEGTTLRTAPPAEDRELVSTH